MFSNFTKFKIFEEFIENTAQSVSGEFAFHYFKE